MKTDNHEVIFAIVNSGFADDVMEVARAQGVRGGTILNARGVAREEAAAFFGIAIHAEKACRRSMSPTCSPASSSRNSSRPRTTPSLPWRMRPFSPGGPS